MLILTIDSGTSNTRAKLWRDGGVIAKSFAEVGVRDTVITGSREKLQTGVRQAISQAAQSAGIDIREVGLILASGMITSNVGLCEVPHVLAPAGLAELARGMVKSQIDAVVEQPIWFVPGIKNHVPSVNLDTYEAMDIMRGEEAETFGLIEQFKLQGPAVFVLPGSHSKFISIDAGNRVTGCLTTLAGELLDIITKHTILAGALGRSFAQEFDETIVLAGGRCARRVGLARTCFSVRILELFGGTTANQRANFLLGALLQTDLMALQNSSALRWSPEAPVVVSGRRIIRQALKTLLRDEHSCTGEIIEIDDRLTEDMAAIGAMTIARERGILG